MKVLGRGIYGYAECSKLLGISPQKVRAWFRGWHGGASSLLQSDYAGMFLDSSISFLDFVDAAVAVTLKEKHGVSNHIIRRLRKRLELDWKTLHPFAREEFFTDESGRRVFCTLAEADGESSLIEILKNQYAIPQVLLPFLKRVEYNAETKHAQVFPVIGKVVLDPRRKCGKPIVSGTGMPTAILYQCYLATDCAETVADWYDVSPQDVEEAIGYERDFKGIAA